LYVLLFGFIALASLRVIEAIQRRRNR